MSSVIIYREKISVMDYVREKLNIEGEEQELWWENGGKRAVQM